MNANVYKNTFLPRRAVLENVSDIFSQSKVIRKYVKANEHAGGFDCDFILYNHEKKYYDIITLFIDKSTKSFCSAASLFRFYLGDFKVLKYVKPENPTIKINNYYVTEDNIYNSIDFEKLASLTQIYNSTDD